jgi:hypothetical protein
MHAGLSEVYLTYSRQRRRGKYLLTKFVREGTYIDVVERVMPRGLVLGRLPIGIISGTGSHESRMRGIALSHI